jgi:hypothetical protein
MGRQVGPSSTDTQPPETSAFAAAVLAGHDPASRSVRSLLVGRAGSSQVKPGRDGGKGRA